MSRPKDDTTERSSRPRRFPRATSIKDTPVRRPCIEIPAMPELFGEAPATRREP